jgi:hypothetical protein
LAVHVAFDSVPLARMRALRATANAGARGATVADVHRDLGRGNRWAAMWELAAPAAIGLVQEISPTKADARPRYRLAEEWLELYEVVACTHTPPRNQEENTGSILRIRTLEPTLDEALRDPALFAHYVKPFVEPDSLASPFGGSRAPETEAMA